MAEDFFDVDEDGGSNTEPDNSKEDRKKGREKDGVATPEKKHRIDTDFDFEYEPGDSSSFDYNTDNRAKLAVAVLLLLLTYYLAGFLGAVPLF